MPITIDQIAPTTPPPGLDAETPEARLEALRAACAEPAPARGDWLNLHCHPTYSYNGYGMSPTALVWLARSLGLSHVGLVDFDTVDAVEEFHAAGGIAGVRTVASLETRAFIEPFATREINSPGEPGITYHMIAGFVDGTPAADPVMRDLRERSDARNRDVIARVNAHLAPLAIDYDADVLPLTPADNATERHICVALQRAAETRFGADAERAAFWQDKLGVDVADQLEDDARLQGTIRSKLMKRGGVAYQQPDRDTFPRVDTIDELALRHDAIPTMTWLDGLSDGERAVDELLDAHAARGVVACNIIPDRNWNIADEAVKADKLAALARQVDAAVARGWFLVVGTELNAPGLKPVDDFDAPELAPFVDHFRFGADVLYGHTVARRRGQPGYCHPDTIARFPDLKERAAHFAAIGRAADPTAD